MIKAEYENFFESKTVTKTERSLVEANLNLSEENEQKILCLSGRVYQSSAEVEDRSVVYGGLATFNAVFGGEELMRVEVGTKFSFKTEQADGAAFRSVDYALDNIKIKKEGGMLYVTAYLTATLTFISVEEKQFLVETTALKKTGVLPIFTPMATTRNFTAEDEFELKKIKRVLYSDATAYVASVTAGDEVVSISGTAIVNVLALPFAENGDLIKETRRIPFTFEAELGGANDKTLATATVAVDKLTLKVFVDDENDRSTVEATAVLTIAVSAANRTDKEIVSDCYSPKAALTLTPVTLTSRIKCANKSINAHFQEKANCAVPEYSRFIKTVGERVEIAAYSLSGGELSIEGLIIASALFSDDENRVVTRRLDIPFNVRQRVEDEEIEDLGVYLEKLTCKLKNGRLETETDLVVAYREVFTVAAQAVSALYEGEERKFDAHTVSVYIPSVADDEWEITKKLGVDWAEIEKFNPDLNFPLTGNEKIIVFRGK